MSDMLQESLKRYKEETEKRNLEFESQRSKLLKSRKTATGVNIAQSLSVYHDKEQMEQVKLNTANKALESIQQKNKVTDPVKQVQGKGQNIDYLKTGWEIFKKKNEMIGNTIMGAGKGLMQGIAEFQRVNKESEAATYGPKKGEEQFINTVLKPMESLVFGIPGGAIQGAMEGAGPQVPEQYEKAAQFLRDLEGHISTLGTKSVKSSEVTPEDLAKSLFGAKIKDNEDFNKLIGPHLAREGANLLSDPLSLLLLATGGLHGIKGKGKIKFPKAEIKEGKLPTQKTIQKSGITEVKESPNVEKLSNEPRGTRTLSKEDLPKDVREELEQAKLNKIKQEEIAKSKEIKVRIEDKGKLIKAEKIKYVEGEKVPNLQKKPISLSIIEPIKLKKEEIKPKVDFPKADFSKAEIKEGKLPTQKSEPIPRAEHIPKKMLPAPKPETVLNNSLIQLKEKITSIRERMKKDIEVTKKRKAKERLDKALIFADEIKKRLENNKISVKKAQELVQKVEQKIEQKVEVTPTIPRKVVKSKAKGKTPPKDMVEEYEEKYKDYTPEQLQKTKGQFEKVIKSGGAPDWAPDWGKEQIRAIDNLLKKKRSS